MKKKQQKIKEDISQWEKELLDIWSTERKKERKGKIEGTQEVKKTKEGKKLGRKKRG